MKTTLAFFALLTGMACSRTAAPMDDFEKLAWLTGHWERVGLKNGRSAHERWEKVSGKEMRGWGVSLQGADTAFVEKLRITTKDGNLYYVAEVPENPAPVHFRFTSLSGAGFTCENPGHDFPKKIQYQLLGDTLKANLTGAEVTSVPFTTMIFSFVIR